MVNTMHEYAPFPQVLADLVKQLRYWPGWRFTLEDIVRDEAELPSDCAGGLTLVVLVTCPDAYHLDRQRSVVHYKPVPAATFNEESWTDWLFQQLTEIELHERCEAFRFATVVEGVDYRPYAPTHGPGDNPYRRVQLTSDEARRTRFTGEVLPPTRRNDETIT